MSTRSEFTILKRSSPLYLAALLILWGLFGFLTVIQFLRKETASQDPQRLQELQSTSLPAEQRNGSDWPQWRGPGRDGFSPETGLLGRWPPEGPSKLWEMPSGEGFSSVAVAQGKVYSMVQDGGEEAIVCWDADTGKEIWRHRYPARFTHKFGNGPRSTPTVDSERVYTVGATGIMTCLKIVNQAPEVLWTKPLLEEFSARNIEWGTAMSPLIDGDLVIVSPGGPGGRSLAALDKYTGAIRWQSQDDAASNSSPVLADSAGRRQVIFFMESGLVAVTPDQGRLLWRYPWVTDFGANIATPIVAGDYVFLSSGYGKGCAMLKIEKKGDDLEPNLVYKNTRMKNHFSTCVRYKEHLYGFNDTTLTCMEFKTGKVTWTERGFDKGSLTIADGHLYILGEYGTMALAEARADEYREVSRFSFSQNRCWSMPVIARGKLYLRDETKIACYDLRKR